MLYFPVDPITGCPEYDNFAPDLTESDNYFFWSLGGTHQAIMMQRNDPENDSQFAQFSQGQSDEFHQLSSTKKQEVLNQTYDWLRSNFANDATKLSVSILAVGGEQIHILNAGDNQLFSINKTGDDESKLLSITEVGNNQRVYKSLKLITKQRIIISSPGIAKELQTNKTSFINEAISETIQLQDIADLIAVKDSGHFLLTTPVAGTETKIYIIVKAIGPEAKLTVVQACKDVISKFLALASSINFIDQDELTWEELIASSRVFIEVNHFVTAAQEFELWVERNIAVILTDGVKKQKAIKDLRSILEELYLSRKIIHKGPYEGTYRLLCNLDSSDVFLTECQLAHRIKSSELWNERLKHSDKPLNTAAEIVLYIINDLRQRLNEIKTANTSIEGIEITLDAINEYEGIYGNKQALEAERVEALLLIMKIMNGVEVDFQNIDSGRDGYEEIIEAVPEPVYEQPDELSGSRRSSETRGRFTVREVSPVSSYIPSQKSIAELILDIEKLSREFKTVAESESENVIKTIKTAIAVFFKTIKNEINNSQAMLDYQNNLEYIVSLVFANQIDNHKTLKSDKLSALNSILLVLQQYLTICEEVDKLASGDNKTLADANCGLNVIALAIYDLVQLNQFTEKNREKFYQEAKVVLGLESASQEALKKWFAGKNKIEIQQSLAKLLRGIAIVAIDNNYEGNYKDHYQNTICAFVEAIARFRKVNNTVYDSEKDKATALIAALKEVDRYIYVGHEVIYKRAQEFAVELEELLQEQDILLQLTLDGQNCEEASKDCTQRIDQLNQKINKWWDLQGKQIFFANLKRNPKHVDEKDTWVDDGVLDALAKELEISFTWHLLDGQQSVGVNAGKFSGTEKEAKLLECYGIVEKSHGRFYFKRFKVADKPLTEKMAPLTQQEQEIANALFTIAIQDKDQYLRLKLEELPASLKKFNLQTESLLQLYERYCQYGFVSKGSKNGATQYRFNTINVVNGVPEFDIDGIKDKISGITADLQEKVLRQYHPEVVPDVHATNQTYKTATGTQYANHWVYKRTIPISNALKEQSITAAQASLTKRFPDVSQNQEPEWLFSQLNVEPEDDAVIELTVFSESELTGPGVKLLEWEELYKILEESLQSNRIEEVEKTLSNWLLNKSNFDIDKNYNLTILAADQKKFTEVCEKIFEYKILEKNTTPLETIKIALNALLGKEAYELFIANIELAGRIKKCSLFSNKFNQVNNVSEILTGFWQTTPSLIASFSNVAILDELKYLGFQDVAKTLTDLKESIEIYKDPMVPDPRKIKALNVITASIISMECIYRSLKKHKRAQSLRLTVKDSYYIGDWPTIVYRKSKDDLYESIQYLSYKLRQQHNAAKKMILVKKLARRMLAWLTAMQRFYEKSDPKIANLIVRFYKAIKAVLNSKILNNEKSLELINAVRLLLKCNKNIKDFKIDIEKLEEEKQHINREYHDYAALVNNLRDLMLSGEVDEIKLKYAVIISRLNSDLGLVKISQKSLFTMLYTNQIDYNVLSRTMKYVLLDVIKLLYARNVNLFRPDFQALFAARDDRSVDIKERLKIAFNGFDMTLIPGFWKKFIMATTFDKFFSWWNETGKALYVEIRLGLLSFSELYQHKSLGRIFRDIFPDDGFKITQEGRVVYKRTSQLQAIIVERQHEYLLQKWETRLSMMNADKVAQLFTIPKIQLEDSENNVFTLLTPRDR